MRTVLITNGNLVSLLGLGVLSIWRHSGFAVLQRELGTLYSRSCGDPVKTVVITGGNLLILVLPHSASPGSSRGGE